MITIELDIYEVRAIRKALGMLKDKCLSSLQQNRRNGWEPEPGKRETGLVILNTVNNLFDKIPRPVDNAVDNSTIVED